MAASTPASTQAAPKQTVICVFCGSKPGSSPAHLAAARELAHVFAKHNIKLVYGGGSDGIMGEIARTLVSLSGPDAVHGVIPTALVSFEAAGRPLGKDTGEKPAASETSSKPSPESAYGHTTVVRTMHERKQKMAELVVEGGEGSGFVAMSGGFGTIEEVMEMTTWNQLGIHDKPVCLFNVDGIWNGLVQWIRDSVGAGFISEKNGGILAVSDTAEGCVQTLKNYRVSEDRFNLSWDKK